MESISTLTKSLAVNNCKAAFYQDVFGRTVHDNVFDFMFYRFDDSKIINFPIPINNREITKKAMNNMPVLNNTL